MGVEAQLLGKTGWKASPIGFGAYRIDVDSPSAVKQEDALRLALKSGCNLIDTSTNYGDGGSERLIGRVLAEAEVRRDDVFIVSKAGYIQGENLKLARARQHEGKGFADIVEYSSDCWHCISPEFLEDQLSRSLARLGLARLDALLLHNPEYFLKAGGLHAEYYRRIEAAFRWLETEADRGRIRFYGISSNTFPEPRDSPEFTSLEAACEIAGRIGPANRFALIQFPFNLYEPGAVLETNCGRESVAEYARRLGLGTLVNRPLNAFAAGRLVRLADYPSHSERDVVGDFKSAMSAATALEARYPGAAVLPVRAVSWAHVIRENFARLSDLESWNSFRAYRAEPSVANACGILAEKPEYREWVSAYRSAAAALFDAVTVYLESQASVESDRIAVILDQVCGELASTPTLSRKALRLYRSLPGLDCILVGMRQTQYVRDAMALGAPPEAQLSPESARRCLVRLAETRNA